MTHKGATVCSSNDKWLSYVFYQLKTLPEAEIPVKIPHNLHLLDIKITTYYGRGTECRVQPINAQQNLLASVKMNPVNSSKPFLNGMLILKVGNTSA